MMKFSCRFALLLLLSESAWLSCPRPRTYFAAIVRERTLKRYTNAIRQPPDPDGIVTLDCIHWRRLASALAGRVHILING